MRKPREDAKLLFPSSISLQESSYHSRKESERKCTFLGNSFLEVNISVELRKDKTQVLKDYQEIGVTYQGHPRLPMESMTLSALNLFCTQSTHRIIGKQTYQAKPWTVGPVRYC